MASASVPLEVIITESNIDETEELLLQLLDLKHAGHNPEGFGITVDLHAAPIFKILLAWPMLEGILDRHKSRISADVAFIKVIGPAHRENETDQAKASMFVDLLRSIGITCPVSAEVK
jgi:hypothetical protein